MTPLFPPRRDLLHCEMCNVAPLDPPTVMREASASCRRPRVTLTSVPPLPPIPNFRLPSVFSRPWTEIVHPPAFRFNTSLVAAGTPVARSEAPQRLSMVDFLPAIATLADGIERMDLDFFNVSVNGGSNLSRFSEYTPRAIRPAEPNLIVYANTRARIHGEIRPVRGTGESLITRMSVDFNPNVWNVVALNNLEIDGFAAVDPPTIRYDRRFLSRTSVDEIIGHGEFGYENPLGTGTALATPFDGEAETPPHRDWMFRFSPVPTSGLSMLQESVANGDTLLRFGYGALMLWAFFPTLGLTDASHYDSLGIRYNTFPRRFGDVVRIFSPLFDPDHGFALREAAPFINPNTEMIVTEEELAWMNEERAQHSPPLLALRGLRQAIPRDRLAVERFNEHRRQLNVDRARQGLPTLPEISASRGPVIDWFATDLARDVTRLAAIADADLPYVDARLRLRDVTLPLPIGQLQLRQGTEIRAHYFLERVEHPGPGESSVRLALNLTLEPLEVGRVSIDQRGVGINAQSLTVTRGVIELRFPMMQDPNTSAPSPSVHLRLEGVQAQGLELNAEEAGLHAVLPTARIGSLEFTRSSNRDWSIQLANLHGENVEVDHPALDLTLGSIDLPELNVQRHYNAAGEPEELVIRGPALGIEGIHTDGRIPIRDGSFHLNNGEISLRQGSMNFEGDLDFRAALPNGFSEGPTVLGNLTLSPDIEDLHVAGRAHFEFFQDGWNLRRAEGGAPLNIGFRIANSSLSHCPSTLPGFLADLPAADIIETRVQVTGAEVQLEDLQSVQYRQVDTEAGRRGQIRELHSGPITVHHVTGGGSIWVGLPIWGFVRGLFPELGVTGSARSRSRERRPDMSVLTAHLPQAVRDLLGDGDFLRIAGIDHSRDSEGNWQTQITDLIMNIHETGGRGQFGGIRVPSFRLESGAATEGRRRPVLSDYWANIFLNDPDRGGSFRFVRWPVREP